MNLSTFDRFCPSLKTRAQLEERIDLNKFDRNSERYFIPMHRKNFWIFGLTNGCRNLESSFSDCRSITLIPVRSTEKVGDRLKERED
jgi:hypothetical protein